MKTVRNPILICFTAIFIAGCASNPRFGSGSGGRTPDRTGGGSPVLTIEGIASYYAHDFHGRMTANGEMYDITAAHKTFPFHTIVRVHNLDNGNQVTVRINDRGPFVEGRIIDVSYSAARKLNMIQSGTARVRLEIMKWGE